MIAWLSARHLRAESSSLSFLKFVPFSWIYSFIKDDSFLL